MSRESRLALWLAPLCVLFVGAIAYSNSLLGPFVFDDVAAIPRNPQVMSLKPFKYPAWEPTTITGRPVAIATFALDYAIARLNVPAYHLTNLIIHVLAALALYGLIRRTLLGIKELDTVPVAWLAAVAAGMWAAHPLTTQSVTYIVQRVESLASLFLLISIYCLSRAVKGGWFWGMLAALACALGVGSKEMVAVAPLLALLYDRAFMAGSFREALRRRWGIYAAMAASWPILAVLIHSGTQAKMAGFHFGISPLDSARTELNVIALYLRLALWPTGLCFDYYDWPIARHWTDVGPAGWLVLGLLIFTLVAQWRWPRAGFLGAWFFLILMPTSSIMPVYQEMAAEQRMYLPLAAVVCAVILGGWLIVRRRQILQRAAALAACAIVLVLVQLTRERNDQYSTAVAIWNDTVQKRPADARARVNLGEAWAQMAIDFGFAPGSPEAVAAAQKAAEQFKIVIELDPRLTHAVFLLGQSLVEAGQPLEAEALYSDAIPKYPAVAGDLYLERGNLRARRNDWKEAGGDFLAAMQAEPNAVEPHYFMGVLDQMTGNLEAAQSELQKAVKISARFKDAARRLQQVRDELAHVGAATRR